MGAPTSDAFTYVVSNAIYVAIVDFVAARAKRFEPAGHYRVLLMPIENRVIARTVHLCEHSFYFVEWFVIRRRFTRLRAGRTRQYDQC